MISPLTLANFLQNLNFLYLFEASYEAIKEREDKLNTDNPELGIAVGFYLISLKK